MSTTNIDSDVIASDIVMQLREEFLANVITDFEQRLEETAMIATGKT